MSEPTEFTGLLREVVQALERSTAELHKLEATLERQQKVDDKAMADVKDEIRRLSEQVKDVTSLWAAQQKAEKVAQERRANAIAAVWKAPAFQMLFIGFVVVILQVLGVSWIANHYLPTIQISGENK